MKKQSIQDNYVILARLIYNMRNAVTLDPAVERAAVNINHYQKAAQLLNMDAADLVALVDGTTAIVREQHALGFTEETIDLSNELRNRLLNEHENMQVMWQEG